MLQAEPRQVLISGDDDVPAAAPSAPAALDAAPAGAPAHAPEAEQAASVKGQANDNEPAIPPEPATAEAARADGQTMDAVKPAEGDDWVTLAAAAPSDAHAAEPSPAKGGHEAAAAKSEEDGSVEDLSDEEREAERAARRPRALAPDAGPVLMDADEAAAVAA